jgi:FkbM family methyltransferase
MIVLDVGANIGYFTLIAAKLTGKAGRVYAFEPQLENYRLLVRNIQANDYNNIIPINMAMSNSNGKLRLFVDKVNKGAHSFSDRNLIEKGGAVDVKTITMDGFLKSIPEGHIDFIKMDTQGAEGLIIEGADLVLKAPGLKMIIEFWPWGLKSVGTEPLQLLKKLQNYGFNIKVIDETSQSIKDMEFVELIKVCESADNGWGYFNLLLEKGST